ncbi:hypothetical protein HOLleu_38239 [Holothuria leucospilota]|uniref:Uncharacterized protein n=1 Tax=Holothuria leucospilota TaxID=206669 RepID=A0A9Q0YKM8_HOLLE|nr:hypothetical protein HOLleu_38239 [Holothuria leucospilota]
MAGSTLAMSRSSETLNGHNNNRISSAGSRDQFSDATWMTRGGQHPMGKGQRLFTGPGGVRDYRAHVVTDDRMVGIGTMSPEGTSELRYIWRGAAGTPPPKSRSQWVGEIGWFMPFIDMQNMRTGHQINSGTFRSAQEDKYTHRFQEPWYPAPNHPNYSQGFPFTKGRPTSTVFQNSPQPSYAQSKHIRRPHTVASFNSTDRSPIPNMNNSAQTFQQGNQSDYTGSTQSLNRPASGSHISAVSVHSDDRSFFQPTSRHSGSLHNNSRPSSGVAYTSTLQPGERPPSVNLSNASRIDALGRRPISGSSSKSAPGSVSHVSYGSGHSTPQSHRSVQSFHKSGSPSRSHRASRQSSGRSTGSRRGIVPAATSIYRPTPQPDY